MTNPAEPHNADTQVTWERALPVAAALLMYAQTWFFGFTNWDDRAYILNNPLLQSPTLSSLLAIWTPGAIANERLYIPLTYTSFWFEAIISGLSPHLCHVTNTLLHGLNTYLVFVVTRQWHGRARGAFWTALIFAVHPLQVEAVAWIMGRKDLLAAVFGFAAIWSWQQYRLQSRWQYYGGTLLFFVGAVLAKPTVIILPVLLPLVDRLLGARVTGRLIPLIGLLPVSVVGFLINRRVDAESVDFGLASVGWVVSVFGGWLNRIALVEQPNVFYSLVATAARSHDQTRLVIPTITVILAIHWLVASWRQRLWPALVFWVIAFLPAVTITLSPDREFITADRYGYFPLLGVFFIVGCIPVLCRPQYRRRATLIVAVWTIIAGVRTVAQTRVWQSSETVWQQALLYDPNNAVAYNSLGNAAFDGAQFDAAIAWYRRAITSRPGYLNPRYNLGRTLSAVGRLDAAIVAYRQALEIDRHHRSSRYNLAVLYYRQGDWASALRELAHLVHEPNDIDAYMMMGLTYAQMGDHDAALTAFGHVVAVVPGHVSGWFKIGVSNQYLGRPKAALAAYTQLLRLQPEHMRAHYNAAVIYSAMKNWAAAESHLIAAHALSPDDEDVRAALAVCRQQQTYKNNAQIPEEE